MKIRSYEHLFESDNTPIRTSYVQVHENLSEIENLLVSGEVLARDRLSEVAGSLANADQVSLSVRPDFNLLKKLKKQESFIKAAYFYFDKSAREGNTLTAGAEWLLDNNHVVNDHIISLKRQLSPKFYKNLPRISSSSDFKGLPRIYKLAFYYLAHSDGAVDTDYCLSFVDAYQNIQPLDINELWAFPLMLRLVSIQRLELLLAINLEIGREQRLIESVVQKVLSDEDCSGTELLQQLISVLGGDLSLIRMAALPLIRQLRLKGTQALLSIQWLEEKLKEIGVDAFNQSLSSQKLQAANQIAIGNSVTALNTIAASNWKKWFEKTSRVDVVLMQDPAKVFGLSDFETRDRCRKVVERIARRTSTSELDIATRAIDFTVEKTKQAQQSLINKEYSVVQCLLDDCLPELEAAVNYQQRLPEIFARRIKKNSLAIYFGSLIGLFTILTFVLFSFGIIKLSTVGLLSALLASIPASELVLRITQYLMSKIFPPAILAKYDFDEGLPDDIKAVVAINVVFDTKEGVDRAINSLEVRYLANQDKQLKFVLLADFAAADKAELKQDQDILSYANSAIKKLNERYEFGEDKFYVLFRNRVWVECEQQFLGWERKRGKLKELNRLLLDDGKTTFISAEAVQTALKGSKYVITLDSDTELPPGSARKLIATISHPLNKPEFDENNIIKKGYSVIQPCVKTSLSGSQKTSFSALMAGADVGLDPYNSRASETYQDLFDQGLYLGKGVYDVEQFQKALSQRVPEQTLLSHDLFEGLYCGVGLATDIDVIDSNPTRYNTSASRMQRWIRGDWQLLPWLFSKVPNEQGNQQDNVLNFLSRWKIFDNIRRSLVVPTSFFLILVVAVSSSTSALLAVMGLIATIYVWPILTSLVGLLLGFDYRYSARVYIKSAVKKINNLVGQSIVGMAVIPYEALISLKAIGSTLYRVFVSRKNLLEWQTADQAERTMDQSLASYLLAFLLPSGFCIVALWLVFELNPVNISFILPLFLLWVSAPFIVNWLSHKTFNPQSKISQTDKEYLSQLAFDTWLFFDRHLNSENHHLMPDNLQVVPEPQVAQRTSPTNIGLSILSVVSAYDLGFISLAKKLNTLDNICASLETLELYKGHLFNWYSTANKQPLHPRYISFVDSGNFIAFLIAAQSALKNSSHKELLSWQSFSMLNSLLIRNASDLQAARISVDVLSQHLSNSTSRKTISFDLLVKVLSESEQLLNSIKNTLQSSKNYRKSRVTSDMLALTNTLADYNSLNTLIAWYEPWQNLVEQVNHNRESLNPRSLRTINTIQKTIAARPVSLSLLQKIFNRFKELSSALDSQGQVSVEMQTAYDAWCANVELSIQSLGDISTNISNISDYYEKTLANVDFEFLYDSSKDLFYVGYSVDDARYDNSRYDLLASEARLGSMAAIALGTIPPRHWFSMRRAFARSFGREVLLSWSGTMFEYLMPLLLMKDSPGTLLYDASHAAVRAQMVYAQKRRVPWGVSESGYSGVDFHKNYQYKAFGVPGLGLKRGLVEDLVISPYATGLALLVDPQQAIENLRRLEKYDARGEYGFYEAVDFTAERLSEEEPFHVVNSFLAHHQGMILVAINNLLSNNIFQERFHRSPCIQAFELLLHEKSPDKVRPIQPHQAEISSLAFLKEEERARKTEIYYSPHTVIPRTRLLSNGNYSVLIDNAGSGHSFFNGDTSINRWKEDASNNNLGFFIYLKDKTTNHFWSATYQPTLVEPQSYQVRYHPDRVEYERLDQGIKTHMEVVVDPSNDIEIRKITVTNTTFSAKTIELTSYAELALAKTAADRAHPAFSKMFIESQFIAEDDALVFKRRPRSDHERQLYAFHKLTLPVCWSPTRFETSRSEFIGRGLGAQNPKALQQELTGSCGMILDPVMSLRTDLELRAGEKAEAYFILGVTDSYQRCQEILSTFHDLHAIEHAFGLAWSQSHVELRHQLFTIAQTLNFQHLANCIVHNVPEMRGPELALQTNRLTQSGFWRFGISGDLPIVAVRLSEPGHIKLAHELLLAHEYLRLRGLSFDLLLLNEYPGGYFQDFQNDLEVLIRTSSVMHAIEQNGGVYLRNRGQLSDEELNLVLAFSRVVLEGRKGSLGNQLAIDSDLVADKVPRQGLFSYISDHDEYYNNYQPPQLNGSFSNGVGCFSNNGKTYEMRIGSNSLPPAPWSNIIANPNFGFLVTESGSGYTWSGNSRENRLTPWSNDPVSDPPSEVVYIRDADTGAYWSATPKPVDSKTNFCVKHGFGYSEFSSQIKGIYSKLTITGSTQESVKWYSLELTNGDYVTRNLELYFYVEPVLGINRELSYRMQNTSFSKAANCLSIVNFYNNEFAGRVAFIGSNLPIEDYTADRLEFIGRNRTVTAPLFLEQSVVPSLANLIKSNRTTNELSRQTGCMLDTCAVLKVSVELQPRETRKQLFYLAEAENQEQSNIAAQRFGNLEHQEQSFTELSAFWEEATNIIQVTTPDESFNTLVNGWLTYQNLSCRIWGRSAFYQSGGAFGFRDQLQDSAALLYLYPELTKQQILVHAARQFIEGDVQHWWHPPTGRGVRTRISDDYLWLPYVVERYVSVTGDKTILEEQVNFIEGAHLEPDQHEIYIVPKESSHSASIYEHCIIALDRCLDFGAHGLPLMGGGDWNDGMNEVGLKGRGESVWLGWFIYDLLQKFIPVIEARADKYRSELYRARAEKLLESIEKHAWDGKWYLRAFFDDGSPLGSHLNDECQIDAIAQAWSVISGAAPSARSSQALNSVYSELVKSQDGIICLLDPPFDNSKPSPGYIQGYLPGIRENGGQYTHAAAWVIMATAMKGAGDKAFELFNMINPINHTSSTDKVNKYRGEPYVLCGDVYSGKSFPGRAGWSWYTGSAGWLYRVAIEFILGLQITDQVLKVAPCVPKAWKNFSLNYKLAGHNIVIAIENPLGLENGVSEFYVDGQKIDSQSLDLKTLPASKVNTIHVRVVMG